MVNVATFLPPPQTLSILSKLRGPVTLWGPTGVRFGLSVLWLSDLDQTLRLSVACHHVVFKFEVFELIIETSSLPPSTDRVRISEIGGWDAVKCLFPVEWQRPATPEEAAGAHGRNPAIGVWGKLDELPSTASISAVTMVGIAFCAGEEPVGAILADDLPFTLRLLDGSEQARAPLVGCEVVRPEHVETWSQKALGHLNR